MGPYINYMERNSIIAFERAENKRNILASTIIGDQYADFAPFVPSEKKNMFISSCVGVVLKIAKKSMIPLLSFGVNHLSLY